MLHCSLKKIKCVRLPEFFIRKSFFASADALKNNEMHYYFCGPVGFMQHVAKQLQALGVDADRMHYECFGPHKVV